MLTFGDQFTISQAAGADQRVRRAQPGIVAAKGNLQGLGDELNFADAATTELYIESRFRRARAVNQIFSFDKRTFASAVADADIRSKHAIVYQLREGRVQALRNRRPLVNESSVCSSQSCALCR